MIFTDRNRLNRPMTIAIMSFSLMSTFYCQEVLAETHCDNITEYDDVIMTIPTNTPYLEAGCVASSQASFVKQTQLNQLQAQHNQVNNTRRNSMVSNNSRVASVVFPFHIDGVSGTTESQDQQLSLYLTVQSKDGRRKQTANATGFDFDGQTFVVGLDFQLSDSLFLGSSFSVDNIDSDFDLVGGASGGGSELKSQTLAVNVAKYWGDNWAWQNQMSVSKQDINTVRNNFRDRFVGENGAKNHAVISEVVYSANFDGWRVTPSVGITYLSGDIEGYQEVVEQGIGPAISVSKQDIDAFSANLSMQVDRVILTDFGVLIPTLRVAVVKEFDDEDERAAITLINDASTAQVGDQVDTSTFNVEAGLSGQFTHGWSGFINYRKFSGHDYLSIESISLGVRVEF